ncbi:MAG: hypothetical protein JWP89_4904 [Schlesneria sp.]|nr:hypothetical protein [Schlesneria sp.]
MEVVAKKVRDAGAGTVVRQFVPTRIERQVLAHVFALVYGGSPCQTKVDSNEVGTAPAQHVSDDEQRTEACDAGRRAA